MLRGRIRGTDCFRCNKGGAQTHCIRAATIDASDASTHHRHMYKQQVAINVHVLEGACSIRNRPFQYDVIGGH